ncbi:hypothetical protein IMZ48_00925 [Candidatus Bathyarchaeota archaeon]|nr:hypothetical protein [Candidatus Bathyarchaeota archaeon]
MRLHKESDDLECQEGGRGEGGRGGGGLADYADAPPPACHDDRADAARPQEAIPYEDAQHACEAPRHP